MAVQGGEDVYASVSSLDDGALVPISKQLGAGRASAKLNAASYGKLSNLRHALYTEWIC